MSTEGGREVGSKIHKSKKHKESVETVLFAPNKSMLLLW
jgi:hypothetical protein